MPPEKGAFLLLMRELIFALQGEHSDTVEGHGFEGVILLAPYVITPKG